MRGEDQSGLAVASQTMKALFGLRRIDDVANGLLRRVEHAEAVDMGKFRPYTAEVVPEPAQDALDFASRLFRECRDQIRPPDLVLLEPGAERAHEGGPRLGDVFSIDSSNSAQRPDREPTKRSVSDRLGLSPEAGAQRDHARRSAAVKN